jgi:hypothetical protein
MPMHRWVTVCSESLRPFDDLDIGPSQRREIANGQILMTLCGQSANCRADYRNAPDMLRLACATPRTSQGAFALHASVCCCTVRVGA